jgi:uncharacterized membrane protein YphA (DoxX/SURF4 family)
LKRVVDWILRVIVAVILLQTLTFKFTGAEESVYIFSTVGVEPWGRYATGIAELFASVLILIPRTAWLGGFLGLGIMAGAILIHTFLLGISVQDDSGLLFGLAIVVFVSSVATLLFHRQEIPLPVTRRA